MQNNLFSRLGFILAVAGGAVGLGNAWKFPTMVGLNGGSAFLLLFLVLTLSIGLTMFLVEMFIGKSTRKDLANAYHQLGVRKVYKLGGIFMLGGILVLSFYLVILSWVFAYIFISFSLPSNIDAAATMFNKFISRDVTYPVLSLLFCFFCTVFTVSKGIKGGIERLNVIVMPMLFILLLLMLIYACFQDGFSDAVIFLFNLDFSKLGIRSILDALGLSLFTLCLGIGCISTYAANMDDKTNIIRSTLVIIAIDIVTSLMMGLIIFTFIFQFGESPEQMGAGLVFISLTSLFAKLGFIGNIFSILFFIALFFAGITSAVSMIEPITFYVEREFKLKRSYSLIIIGFFVLILSLASLFSLHGEGNITVMGHNFFGFLDFITSNIMLPTGILFSSIFVGFVVPRSVVEGFFSPYFGRGFFIFYFLLKYFSPLCIIIIMINNFYPLINIFK